MSSKPTLNLTINRIEALIDGIFAIAMTLLVLSISLPDKTVHLSSGKLHQFLLGQLNEILTYALSFFLLANYWLILHRQFHYFRKTDNRHLWIIMGFLLFACLVPYTTSLTSDFPDDWMAQTYFGTNIFMLGVFVLFNWIYATSNKRLVSAEMREHIVKRGKLRGLIAPLVAVLAIIMAMVAPSYSGYIYLLIPLMHIVQRKAGRTVIG